MNFFLPSIWGKHWPGKLMLLLSKIILQVVHQHHIPGLLHGKDITKYRQLKKHSKSLVSKHTDYKELPLEISLQSSSATLNTTTTKGFSKHRNKISFWISCVSVVVAYSQGKVSTPLTLVRQPHDQHKQKRNAPSISLLLLIQWPFYAPQVVTREIALG